MSKSMYWRLKPRVDDAQSLPIELRGMLAEYLWDEDGSLCHSWYEVDEGAIDFLRGISMASSNTSVSTAAGVLIQGIRDHGGVQVSVRE